MQANNTYSDGMRMTMAIACAIMERAIISVGRKLFQEDPIGGEKFIQSVYDASKRDALGQWRDM